MSCSKSSMFFIGLFQNYKLGQFKRINKCIFWTPFIFWKPVSTVKQTVLMKPILTFYFCFTQNWNGLNFTLHFVFQNLEKFVPKESIWKQIARAWLASADSTGYIGREWILNWPIKLSASFIEGIEWKHFFISYSKSVFNASYSKQQASDNDKTEEKCSMSFCCFDSNKFEFTRTYYIFIGNDGSH